MARIQILRLPEIMVGENFETPFAIVVDQVDKLEIHGHNGDVLRTIAGDSLDGFEGVKDALGARGVIVFDGTLDVVDGA